MNFMNINEEDASTTSQCQNITVHTVTQFSPSPVISCTESVPQGANISQITVDTEHGQSQSSNQSTSSTVLRDVHIVELFAFPCVTRDYFMVSNLMEDFLGLAKDNTEKDLETCGTLGAFLKNGTFYVTTLIIPKQECTSNSVMIPEAFAVVMAPTDTSRSYGIFRLSDPGGMSVLKECQEQGFHPHKETTDGSPIYEHCSNVYTNSNLRFEIFDLR
ncbi:associated molecule with the SH3 domain of STAM 2 [Prunus dulcis]|uniref:Associated molecule with the SH3 domain of STAM 2 n=1 Tax=Prunus dulcis TaxID=3755 RepID=A0A4Y1QQF5_PRUDU|nr:associated molecule with the SH3 domain of STAM 2 [Prunus dulcis]